jgi:hypothetical protein
VRAGEARLLKSRRATEVTRKEVKNSLDCGANRAAKAKDGERGASVNDRRCRDDDATGSRLARISITSGELVLACRPPPGARRGRRQRVDGAGENAGKSMLSRARRPGRNGCWC